MPRPGVGIWAMLGSTGDSWRVLEVWEDQHGRAEASAEQVYLRSFPSRLSGAGFLLIFQGKKAQMLLAQAVSRQGSSACRRLPRGLLYHLLFLLLSLLSLGL